MAVAQSTAPAGPSALSMRVTVVPTEIPADGATHNAVFVQLASASGQVVAAPNTYQIFLTSANVSVATVQSLLVFQKGLTYGMATLTSTSKPGLTNVTLAATGLSPTSVLVNTYAVSSQASRVVTLVAPSVLFSAATSYYYVFVQLQDGSGIPAKTSVPLSVALTSSNPGVASLPPTMTIPAGSSGASAQFSPGSASGSTTITAQLNNLLSSTKTIQSSFLPLTVSVNSSAPQGFSGSSIGVTATALTAGVPLVGANVAWSVDNQADTFGNGTLTTNVNGTASVTLNLAQAGNTTITATITAPGYGSKSASVVVTVVARVLTMTLIPDSTFLNASQPSGVSALVTSGGKPVQGAQVTWSASMGTTTPSSTATGSSGIAKTIFMSLTNGNSTISAQATAPGYGSASAQTLVTVGQLAAGGNAVSQTLGFIPGPALFGIPVLLLVVIVIVVVVLLVRRRRGGRAVAAESEEEEGAAPETVALDPEEE